jgi:hypothetical protein
VDEPDREWLLIDLVLKWSPRLRPDTIERHREVAAERGSVWWGRLSDSDSPGLGYEWQETFQAQLTAHQRTYVFLHSKPGGTWRAHLLGITVDRSKVDALMIPSYYDSSDHYSLWVRLAEFEKFDPSALIEGYTLARTGHPVTLKGLNNQTPSILLRR